MKRLAIVLPFLAAFGCTQSDSRPSPDELDEGLTMLDTSDPSWGVTAAYKKQQHVVYIEQRVGALKPQAYRDQAPQEPANEIDMRFVDETGKTFFVQRGGDNYVDTSWNGDIATSLANPAPDEQRIADFQLAREAAGVFAQKASAPELAAFQFHANAYAARLAPADDPYMQKSADLAESKRPTTDEAYGAWGGGGSWWLQGDLYDKGTGCVFWSCFGRHSAVAMWAYQTTWQLAILTCNHGTCAGGSKMSYDCSSTSGVWRENVSLSGETNGSTSIGNGCSTSYSWNSGGNNHLCNDDSAYELWQIKNGSAGSNGVYGTGGGGSTFTYTGSGTGGDGTWVNYACTCSNNNGCDNDWSRPICP